MKVYNNLWTVFQKINLCYLAAYSNGIFQVMPLQLYLYLTQIVVVGLSLVFTMYMEL